MVCYPCLAPFSLHILCQIVNRIIFLCFPLGPYIPCAEQPYNLFCLANGTGGGCVSDGPFKNAVLHLGPGRNIESNNHCLTRNFHPQFPAQWLSEAEVNRTMAEGSYGRFWRHLEGMFEVERMGLHGAGHLGIGGTQSTTPPNMSPGPRELN